MARLPITKRRMPIKGYRSGLEEANASFLHSRGVKVNYEDPASKVRYSIPESPHIYTPDFVLPNGILVETKGLFTLDDRKKHVLIKQQHPTLDLRFVFQNPNTKLRKGSPTTYAMWAEKEGFKWAAKLIPVAWLEEAGPASATTSKTRKSTHKK